MKKLIILMICCNAMLLGSANSNTDKKRTLSLLETTHKDIAKKLITGTIKEGQLKKLPEPFFVKPVKATLPLAAKDIAQEIMNIQNPQESEKVFNKIIEEYKPMVAKAYLANLFFDNMQKTSTTTPQVLGMLISKLPNFIKKSFLGFSFNDLIDYEIIPIKDFKNYTLSFMGIPMSSLEGINRIPNENKKKFVTLFITNNLLSDLKPQFFEGFDNLKFINLNNNKITKIDPKTFKSLSKLKRLNLQGNSLTENNKKSLKEALPNVSIYF